MHHFTHRFLLLVALVGASLLHRSIGEEKQAPASIVSHPFSGSVESVDVVSDTGHTSIRFHIDSGNILLDTFRIHFNKDSGNATHAWWHTKGGNRIELPEGGLQLKSIPKQGSKVRIEFNNPVPADSSSIGVVRLLAIKSLDHAASPPPAK